MRVPLPPPTDPTSDDVRSVFEKQERVYDALWISSGRGRRMADIGFYGSLLGTSVGVVWPDFKNKRPIFQIRSPRGFWPVAGPNDSVAKCVFYSRYPLQVAKTLFPGHTFDSDPVDVYMYIDEKNVITVDGDGQTLSPGTFKNELGVVPVVAIPNIPVAGSLLGESDLEDIGELSKEVNYRITLARVFAEAQLEQPIVIQQAESFPDQDLPMGTHDIITVAAGGGASRLQPPQVPYEYLKTTDTLIGYMNSVSDTPSSLSSNPADYSGTITGRGVSALTAPIQGRMDMRVTNIIFPALSQMNKIAMMMYEKMFKGKHTVCGYSAAKSSYSNPTPFTETFDIKEFEGWYENVVYRPQGSFYDNEANFIQLLQAVQNNLMAPETAMRFIPGVEDVPAELKRVNASIQQRAEQTLQIQNMMSAPGGTQAPAGEPGLVNSQLSHGYMGQTPPPPAPGGLTAQPSFPKGSVNAQPNPPVGTGNSPESPDTSGVLNAFVDLLRGVANIRGSVYLVGGILRPDHLAAAMNSTTAPEAQLDLTEPLDKQTILNAVKAQEPVIHGKLKFQTVTEEPQDPHIVIFQDGQPAQGYDTVGGDTQGTAEAALPPEMGQLGNAVPEAQTA